MICGVSYASLKVLVLIFHLPSRPCSNEIDLNGAGVDVFEREKVIEIERRIRCESENGNGIDRK
jgi:hypothetical protein